MLLTPPSTIVTKEDVQMLIGRTMTDLELVRAESDIGSLLQILENWTHRKFEQQTFLDERHVFVGMNSEVMPIWAPVKTFLGVRYGDTTQPLMTSWNNYWSNLRFNSGTIAYISYTNDISMVQDFKFVIRDLITDTIIRDTLKSDVIRYGVVEGYSVEGLSMQFGGAANRYNINDVGPWGINELHSIMALRRRLVI